MAPTAHIAKVEMSPAVRKVARIKELFRGTEKNNSFKGIAIAESKRNPDAAVAIMAPRSLKNKLRGLNVRLSVPT